MLGGDFEFIARNCVRELPEYLFEIDEYRRGDDQMLFAHIRVDKFAPSVMKRLLGEWALFRQIVTAPLFAISETDDAKWTRFVTRLGFRPLFDVVCTNGETRKLFINKVDNVRFIEHDTEEQSGSVEATAGIH